MLVGDVVVLMRIDAQVVERLVVEQSPTFPQHGGPDSGRYGGVRGVFRYADRHAAVVDHQHPILERLLVSAQNRRQAFSVQSVGHIRHARQIGERRQQILHVTQLGDIARLAKLAVGPADETGHTVSTLPQRHFSAAHAGVEVIGAHGAAVVGEKHEDRVVELVRRAQECIEASHVLVDVRTHGEIADQCVASWLLEVFDDAGVCLHGLADRRAVLLGHEQGPVRRVERKVGEKRSIARFAFDPFRRFAKEDVGAIALVFLPLAVVHVGVVEIIVFPEIGCGANVRRGEPQRFVETPVLRAERIVVAEMPLAKNAGPVSGGSKHIGHRP